MNLSLLTPTDLNTLFNKDLYLRVVKKDLTLPPYQRDVVKQHALKFLIALNQPDEIIIKFINGRKGQEMISSTYSDLKLTALHVAILTDNLAVGLHLINACANMTQEDARGWKPIHMAAITSQKLFNELIKRKVNPNALNRLGATCSDLRRLVGLDPVADKALLYRRPEAAAAAYVSKAEFEGLTGLKEYSDVSRYSPRDLWMQDEGVDHAINEYLLEQLKKQSALVSVGRVEGIGSKCHALFAEEDICPGTHIGNYTGKKEELEKGNFFSEIILPEESNPYLLDGINAEELGNYTRFANDGFPNCAIMPVFNRAGVAETCVFVVTKAGGIKKGEQILWDYLPGETSLKWNHYAIQNREELHAFFSRKTLSEYLKIEKEMKQRLSRSYDFGKNCELLGFQHRLMYPLTTPMVLIDLTVNLMIQPQAWFTLLTTNFGEDYRAHSPQHMALVANLLRILQNYWFLLQSKDPNVESVKAFFSEGIQKFTVMQLAFAMEWLCRRDLKDWASSKQLLERLLPNYVWHADPGFYLTGQIETMKAMVGLASKLSAASLR